MSMPADAMVPLGARPGSQWTLNRTIVDMTRPPRPVRAVELPAMPQRIVIDANKTALVVIDMQNDFCAPGGWLASIGVDVAAARRPIEPLRRLLPALRRAGVPVIWVNWGNRPDRLNLSPCLLHVYNPDGRSVGLGDPLPGNGAKVLEKGSWAATVVEELTIEPTDVRIDKYRMSGFWDTELDSVLRNLGVTTLLFGGVNADQCVLATLMDANFLGYDTILVEDCTATTSPEYCWQATLYNVRQCFGFSVVSTELIGTLP
jgi:nicotinamidase-related amidase